MFLFRSPSVCLCARAVTVLCRQWQLSTVGSRQMCVFSLFNYIFLFVFVSFSKISTHQSELMSRHWTVRVSALWKSNWLQSIDFPLFAIVEILNRKFLQKQQRHSSVFMDLPCAASKRTVKIDSRTKHVIYVSTYFSSFFFLLAYHLLRWLMSANSHYVLLCHKNIFFQMFRFRFVSFFARHFYNVNNALDVDK